MHLAVIVCLSNFLDLSQRFALLLTPPAGSPTLWSCMPACDLSTVKAIRCSEQVTSGCNRGSIASTVSAAPRSMRSFRVWRRRLLLSSTRCKLISLLNLHYYLLQGAHFDCLAHPPLPQALRCACGLCQQVALSFAFQARTCHSSMCTEPAQSRYPARNVTVHDSEVLLILPLLPSRSLAPLCLSPHPVLVARLDILQALG